MVIPAQKLDSCVALSAHAAVRAQQRGVKLRTLKFVLEFADLERPAGNGCISIWFSESRLAALRNTSAYRKLANRSENLAVILNRDCNTVVTVLLILRRRGHSSARLASKAAHLTGHDHPITDEEKFSLPCKNRNRENVQ